MQNTYEIRSFSLFLFFFSKKKGRKYLTDKHRTFYPLKHYMHIAFNLITSGLLAFDKTYIDNILIK